VVQITGDPTSGMIEFDQVLIDLMNAYAVPGLALAVSRNGQTIIGRGYGLLDLSDPNSLVESNNAFRIASVSKPITAMTVLRIIQDQTKDTLGRVLTLDTLVWDLLQHKYPLLSGKTLATGVDRIKIKHLLQHSAGWDDRFMIRCSMSSILQIKSREVGRHQPQKTK